MVILALDFATATGWALFDGPALRAAGTWHLPPPARGAGQDMRAYDPRPQALALRLQAMAARADVLAFEDVQFATSTAQTQLWASLRTAAWLALPGVRWMSAPPQVLKKLATGKGNADKEAMRSALPPDVADLMDMVGADDNAVDAYWAGRWALQETGDNKWT